MECACAPADCVPISFPEIALYTAFDLKEGATIIDKSS